MTNTARFWDRMAKGYSKRPVPNQKIYEQKLKKTREYLNLDSNVFDFGCGTGSTATLHAPLVKHIHAVDVSKNMLEIARAKMAVKNIKNITFECANIEELDVQDDTYDVVLGMSILHLLEDRKAVIAKLFDILKPGGVFISSTVSLQGAMKILLPFLAIGKFLGLLPTIKFINRKTLENDLITAGFQNEFAWKPGGSAAVFIVSRKPG